MSTLLTPWPSEARPSSNRKPKIPSFIIPQVPINIIDHAPLIKHHKSVQISLPYSPTPQFLKGGLSFAATKSLLSWQESDSPTSDMLALAELFAALKRIVSRLHATFEELGSQTMRLANFAPIMQVDHQIESARAMLEQQIARHEESMREVRHLLENAVHESVIERLKAQINEAISDNVAKEVKSRVQQELSKQLSKRLKRHDRAREIQVQAHTVLCNSEARRRDIVSSPCMDVERLRPLLRPLPSALQSPAHILKLPSTANNSAVVAGPLTPLSAITNATAAAVDAEGSTQVFELVSPMSPRLPCDPKPLSALGSGAAKQPLTDGHKILPVPYSGPNQPEVIMQVDTNTDCTGAFNTEPTEVYITCEGDSLMNHIELPFVMIPVPKPKSGPRLHLVIP